ncbi:MAG: Hemagluttinin repeat-containing protein, partial [Candidatus Woesebacteria bacterium GW2011_GWB1_38_8]
PSSASSTNDGDVHIGTSATLNMEANALSVGGDFDNDGTFSASGSQTTTFTATASGHTIDPNGSSFRNVTFAGGVSGVWSFTTTTTIDLDLTMTLGTLNSSNGTAPITVNGGDATGAGIISLTNSNFTLNATGSFGSTVVWTFSNLTFGAATPGTTSGTGTGSITVNSVLTISSSHVLNASAAGVAKIWNLTATGTPFVNSGTFTAVLSTFDYEGAGSTTITAATYNNLRSQPTSGSPTHYLGSAAGQTFAINSDLTIGDGTNAVTLDANTRDPILDIASDFVLSSNGTFLASNSGVFTIAEDFTDNGTFTHNSGNVTFDGSATSTFSGSGTPVTTFSSFTSATDNKVLEFATGTTWQINATFTIDGSSGNEIKIQSNSSGTQWFINHQGTENITYASVLDGGCASTSTNITVQSSINRGNNDFCWLFPSLAFSLDSVSKSLNLTSANTFTATATSILTVTSTSEFGYDVTAYQTDNLRHTAYSTIIIANWPGTNAAPTVWTDTCQGNSDCGWGYNTNDTDLGQFVATEYAAFVTSTPGDVVARSTIAISGDVTTITYRSSVSATQTAGQYQTTIIYIVTPEF